MENKSSNDHDLNIFANNSNETQIDFTIFDDGEIDEYCDSKTISECKSIHRIITGLIYYQLVNSQYEEIRYLWKVGSMVSIFSRSKNTWFEGEIVYIYIDSSTNKEWFIVKYDQNKKKSIQRLCKDIKPITNNNKDHVYNRQEIFSNFLSQQYVHYLDDIIHFNTKHQNDLEIIHDQILLKHKYYKLCHIDSCIATNTH